MVYSFTVKDWKNLKPYCDVCMESSDFDEDYLI